MKTSWLSIFLILPFAALIAHATPVPLVNNPLVPASVAPGGGVFTLTVNGVGFAPAAIVKWNGVPLATTYVSQFQLTALVPSANIASPRSAAITVDNGDGLLSDPHFLLVADPESEISFLQHTLPFTFVASAPVVGD